MHGHDQVRADFAPHSSPLFRPLHHAPDEPSIADGVVSSGVRKTVCTFIHIFYYVVSQCVLHVTQYKYQLSLLTVVT